MTVSPRRLRAVRNLPLFAFSLLPLMAGGVAHAAGAGAGVGVGPAALPTGGRVVSGQATIGSPSAGSLTVSQSSGKAIINWQGFSIGSGAKVQIDNGSGATLNRVTGNSVSSLNGLLSATGSVYLLNPNGVIVGRTGVVNVGGTFVASTLNVTDANFLQGGDLSFTGTSSAAVVNLGKIGALGGDVALIAATVNNSGSITAADGTAGLVAGYDVVMRDASLDDGLFSVRVGGAGTGVTNGGAILAANAELRAEGGNVYALAGNTAGVIRATGVKAGDGKVWLVADGGALDVAGSIEAQGAKGSAGAIETSGHSVSIGKASVDPHGGTWLVDPADLTIDATAAATLDATLNSTEANSIILTTSASGSGGNGDIIVAAPISWSTGVGLTLSAYRNIDVNASITSTGGGAVVLDADNAATGVGTVIFGSSGGVSTSGATSIVYNPTSYTSPTNYSANVAGGGTLTPYMLINNVQEFQNINTNLAGDYALNPGLTSTTNTFQNSDISGFLDFSSIPNFTPIGSAATPFTGVFNGAPVELGTQGVLSHVTISQPGANYVGLFGVIGKGGVVENVALGSGSVTGGSVAGGSVVGGLAGENLGTISFANVDVGVTGSGSMVGGLVGENFGAVTNSAMSLYHVVTVSGVGQVGGLIGYNGDGGVASDDYAGSSVTGSGNDIGGLIGENDQGASLISVNNVSVYNGGFATTIRGTGTTSSNIGAGAGYNAGTINTIEVSYTTVQGASASSNNIGGIAGYNSGAISGSESLSLTLKSTGADTGGVAGLNDTSGSILSSYAKKTKVTGTVGTGGIAGVNYGAITKSFVTAGSVTGTNDVGGVVGENFASLARDYITTSATVTGVSDVGGVVGLNTTASGGTVTADVETSYTDPSIKIKGTGNYVGGVAGYNDVGSIVANSTGGGGTVTGAGAAAEAIGGLVGYNAGTLSASNTAATIREASANTAAGVDYLGGAVGYNASTGSVTGVTVTPIAGTTGTPEVSGSFSDAGGLVGYNAGAVSGSISAATVATTGLGSYAGGLVGYNAANSTLDGSSASGQVAVRAASSNKAGAAGGLAGYNDGAITNSTSTGNVLESGASDGTAQDALGGLVGYNDTAGTVAGSTGGGSVTVQAADIAGGLVGDNAGLVVDSSSAGSVSATNASGAFLGGLVGVNAGTIGQAGSGASFTTSAVTSDGAAVLGGLVGVNRAGATVTQAYAGGAVGHTGTGASRLGGLVGDNAGAISYAYALGALTAPSGATDSVGGLVGVNEANGTIAQAYATGAVSAATGAKTGGVAGQNLGSIANSVYWDETTTGQAAAAASDDSTDGAIAINVGGTLSPYASTSYANLDFTSAGFVIFDGSTRPFLASEATSNIINLHQFQLMALDLSGSYFLNSSINASATENGGLNSSNMWSSAGFAPIGSDAAPFTGTFNGASYVTNQLYTISNLNISRSGQASVGLFGNIGANATIFNLELNNSTIVGGNATGAVAGKNSGLLSNIVLSGDTVGGADGVGGAVGENYGGVDYAQVTGITVSGANRVGGLIGDNTAAFGDATAETSLSSVQGSVTGSGSYVGGVVGYNDVGASVSSDVFSGSVTSTGVGVGDIGGLVGHNLGSVTGDTDVATVADVAVNGGAASDVGGAVGYNAGTLTNVSVGTTTISSGSNVNPGSVASYGGLVGLNSTNGVVLDGGVLAVLDTQANAVGGVVGKNYGSVTNALYGDQGDSEVDTISGLDAVGGIVGKNFGSVSNSLAFGSVAGRQYVGGAVGWNTTSGAYGPVVSGDVSSGYVAGVSDVGGLVGLNDGGASISGSWADGFVTLAGTTGLAFGPLGGLVGYNGGTITTSYSAAAVSDGQVVSSGAIVLGGLVGENAGSVSDTYSIGKVDATGANAAGYVVGGLVGANDAGATIASGYASGAVSAASGQVGALAGTNAGTLSKLYYDTVTTGVATPVGADTGMTSATAVGGSGADAYAAATYSGLDLSGTWFEIDGSTRPMLRSEYSTTITNAHQLQLMDMDTTATYELAFKIDASATGANASDVWRVASTADSAGDYGFVPIASDAQPFSGTLLGQGQSIGGLTIVRPDAISVGLFANLGADSYVDNLILDAADVTGKFAVGALTGKTSGVISDITLRDGSVISGVNAVGGLIGKNFGLATYLTTDATSTVEGSGAWAGGVVGYNGAPQGGPAFTGFAGVLNYIVSQDTVIGALANGEDDVGGAVGYNSINGKINNTIVTGVVTGAGAGVGGVVGFNVGLAENSILNDATVTGNSAVGGFAGRNYGLVIDDSVENSTITGAIYVGGMVGYNGLMQGDSSTPMALVTGSSLLHTTDTDNVFGSQTGNSEADVGGVVGFNGLYGQVESTVSYSMTVRGAATTGVSGSPYGGFAVGGIVGKNYGDVDSVELDYSTVTGSAAVGGAVGKNFGDAQYIRVLTSTVMGDQYVGGSVGYNGVPMGSNSTKSAVVDQNYVFANVIGTNTNNVETDVGGVVGYNDPYGVVSDSNTQNAVVQGAAVAGVGSAYGGIAVGGLVGANYGLVVDSSARNQTTTGSKDVGGAIGENFGDLEYTVFDTLYTNTSGNVYGDEYVGGIVGYNAVSTDPALKVAGLVQGASYTYGTVTGYGIGGAGTESDVGGLVGYNGAGAQVVGSVFQSFDSADYVVSYGNAVGGAVGKNYGLVEGDAVLLGLNGGSITGADSVGGVVGRNFGTVETSVSQLAVTGADYVGGAIGYNGAPIAGPAGAASVDQVQSIGAVNWTGAAGAGTAFGGLIGYNSGTVSNAYATGAVQNSVGMSDVGGFVGDNLGTISTSYTIAPLGSDTGGTNVGAFAGANSGTFKYDYYDVGINSVTVGGVGAGSQQNLVGLTDAQAHQQSSFEGFDFGSIWAIATTGAANNGYPYLQIEPILYSEFNLGD